MNGEWIADNLVDIKRLKVYKYINNLENLLFISAEHRFEIVVSLINVWLIQWAALSLIIVPFFSCSPPFLFTLSLFFLATTVPYLFLGLQPAIFRLSCVFFPPLSISIILLLSLISRS